MRIALIAHDNKKRLLESLCLAYHQVLAEHQLYTIGTTGTLISETVHTSVTTYLPNQIGGEYHLTTMITLGELDLVIFLRDPINPKAHEPSINTLLTACDRYNVPLASNLASAEVFLRALGEQGLSATL